MSYSKEITTILEQGAKAYAAKNYESAVELYGNACGKASELNNEEDPALLFLYGKALFQVAVSKNGLFGGADEQQKEADNKEGEVEDNNDDEELKKGKEAGMFQFSEDVPLADEEDGEEEENNEDSAVEEEEDGEQEEESNEQEGNEEKEEEQSDFEIAWEILDLSRSLYQQKLDQLTSSGEDSNLELEASPESSENPIIKTILKLSDIHDLLGEISLETENFKQATEDFKILLKLREKIFNFKSNLISEAHYKLSLALEFNYENDNDVNKNDSVHHLKKAIESIKQRDEKDEELVKELELKLEELSRDPNEQLKLQKEEILKGILGEATSNDKTTKIPTSSSTTDQKPVINDLTSIVKKRKPKQQNSANKKPKI